MSTTTGLDLATARALLASASANERAARGELEALYRQAVELNSLIRSTERALECAAYEWQRLHDIVSDLT
jgi:multidrug resistance efflux pump